MRRSLGLILVTATLAAAQTATQTPAPSSQATGPITTLQANSQLVVVDVVVQDKDGNAVHGLKPESFHLTEEKTPQTIRHFEEHSATTPLQPGPQLPPMPPGTFTNYTPVAPNATLNILLLDALNTPATDQNYVRQQLQQYVNKADPGTRIAIFGLASQLYLIQGFTSDPETLKSIVNQKLVARASPLLSGPAGALDQTQNSGPLDPTGLQSANVYQFQYDSQQLAIELRTQYTLDAFNALAHYLAGFPGRKNLIWFSGAFPINVLPDPSVHQTFSGSNMNDEQARETTSLLSKAQVSVYPIDARGMAVDPTYNATSSEEGLVSNPAAANTAHRNFINSQGSEHNTMNTLAENTGGRAFYNTNGIADAVAKAINSGANYYTLSYTPTDARQDGGYRSIHVDVSGPPHLQISYRRGYYADDEHHRKKIQSATASTPTAASSYERAAMSRGAPTPQDLLFKVRVLPASTATEDAVAPGNSLNPTEPAKGPFRRYNVDYLAVPDELQLNEEANGRHTGQIQFIVYVYDSGGHLLNAAGKTIVLNLSPESFAKLPTSPMHAHLEISVPTRQETFLRLGVKDGVANHFGVVEIPVSAVSHLSPPPPAAAAPASPTGNTPKP